MLVKTIFNSTFFLQKMFSLVEFLLFLLFYFHAVYLSVGKDFTEQKQKGQNNLKEKKYKRKKKRKKIKGEDGEERGKQNKRRKRETPPSRLLAGGKQAWAR